MTKGVSVGSVCAGSALHRRKLGLLGIGDSVLMLMGKIGIHEKKDKYNS